MSLLENDPVLVINLADLTSPVGEDEEALLRFAARTHNHEFVEHLISSRVNVNTQGTKGATALHWAVSYVCSSPDTCILIENLLNAGAQVEATDSDGYRPLHWAAHNGNSRATQTLVEEGAVVDAVTTIGQTPLRLAVKGGHLEVIQRLMDGGASIRNIDHDGETALHMACRTRFDNTLDVIECLLGPEVGIMLEPDERGRLAPHQVAIDGYMEAVELFLDMGFNPRLFDHEGFEMIHLAASKGRVDVLELLLGRDIPANCATRIEGHRPVHLAAWEGHGDAISVLCGFEANVNVKARDGCSAIHCAAQGGKDNAISELLRHGADINALDYQGKTAIFYAVQRGEPGTVSLLYSQGALVNYQGCDALAEAVYQENAEIWQILSGTGVT